jgi:protein transport protein SEC24
MLVEISLVVLLTAFFSLVAPIGYTSSSDTNDHPELRKGTVDFLVPSQYWAPVPPKRLIHAFVPVTIENDESSASRKSGESKAPQLPNESISTATRKPGPMNCVFALDVSYEAVQSGFLTSACKIILDILYGGGVSQPSHEDEEDDVEVSEPDPQIFSTWKHGGKVAIITFDRELCFYDLSVSFHFFPFVKSRWRMVLILSFFPARAATSLDNGNAGY